MVIRQEGTDFGIKGESFLFESIRNWLLMASGAAHSHSPFILRSPGFVNIGQPSRVAK